MNWIRKVYCITNKKIYDSNAEAGRILNACSGHISACCHSHRKQTKGLYFKFIYLVDISIYKCGICGKTKENISRYECKECKSKYNKEYRVKNKENISIQSREYRVKNREKVLKAKREYHYKSYENHKEKISQYQSNYYLENKLKIDQNNKRWRINNRDKTRIYSHSRRCSENGKLSKFIVDKLYKYQKGICPCCHEKLGHDYELDHIMPIALGGSNTDDNVQLLKKGCNRRKSSKHPVSYMQSKGFLL